ncbi:MAG: hypothetical protein NT019_02820 [Candidatus Adlerbacteria bacterium]|nr:hypothetical protein [Candidatus Adlerbacteria bacterium]
MTIRSLAGEFLDNLFKNGTYHQNSGVLEAQRLVSLALQVITEAQSQPKDLKISYRLLPEGKNGMARQLMEVEMEMKTLLVGQTSDLVSVRVKGFFLEKFGERDWQAHGQRRSSLWIDGHRYFIHFIYPTGKPTLAGTWDCVWNSTTTNPQGYIIGSGLLFKDRRFEPSEKADSATT